MKDIEFYDLDAVFSIKEVTSNQIILSVKAKDPLTVARYPFLQKKFEYITLTRGKKHILTVIYEDGNTFYFDWGDGGYTLISDSLEMLKKAVCQFIEGKGILLEYTGKPVVRAVIYYNRNFHRWQLTLDEAHYWSKTAKNVEDMKEECRQWIQPKEWVKGIAQTGIDIWTARDFTTTLK